MINPALYVVGAAKQTAKGTPAVAPTFSHGLVSGTPFGPEISNEDVKATGLSRMTTVSSFRNEVGFPSSLGMLAYADALGLYLLGAFGNVTTTGAADPFVHDFTIGGQLPYLTLFQQVGTEPVTSIADAKVGGLELAWEGVKPLDVKVDSLGCVGSWLTGAWPGGAPAGTDEFFVCAGMTALVSTTTGTPGVIEGIVKSGSLKVDNATEVVMAAGSSSPADVSENAVVASGKMTLAPKDSKLARSVITGTDTGTAVSNAQVFGSLKWTFKHNKFPTWGLEVTADGIPFAVSAIDADPSGGIAECDIDFSMVKNLSIKLTNGVASY